MIEPRTGFAEAAAPLRLRDVGCFDVVEIAAPHPCLIDGPAVVLADSEGDMFVECRRGRHYLELFLGVDDRLVGVRKTGR